MELYVNAASSQKASLGNGSSHDGDNRGLPRSQQQLLNLIDPDDPAWPSVAAALREMNDAGVDLGETAVAIATQLGQHRHRLAMTDAERTTRGNPVYRQIIQPAVSTSVVYYARRGDLVKIGTTSDPATRFNTLVPDEILAVEPGDEDLETARHRQFSHLHQRSEYFLAAPELLEHAYQLRSQHGDPDPAWVTTATPPSRRGRSSHRHYPLPPLTSHETITAAEAHRRFGFNIPTVWTWVYRGLISPVGRNEARHQVFYVEDLMAMRDRSSGRK